MPKIGSELLVSTDWQIAESKPIQQFTGRNKTEVEIRHLGAEAINVPGPATGWGGRVRFRHGKLRTSVDGNATIVGMATRNAVASRCVCWQEAPTSPVQRGNRLDGLLVISNPAASEAMLQVTAIDRIPDGRHCSDDISRRTASAFSSAVSGSVAIMARAAAKPVSVPMSSDRVS